MRYLASGAILYLVATALTGGYYYNHRCDEYELSHGYCGNNAIIVSLAWPLYWLGRFGIEVTK